MIDGMDGIEAYLRDAPRRPEAQIIISATRWGARTPRSVEAHGHEERDEHGHPVGTRVSLRFLMSGSGLVSSTASSNGVLMSDADSSAFGGHTITVYMPTTEVGTYVSDQIVDDVKFSAGLMQTTWVPPPVRGHRR